MNGQPLPNIPEEGQPKNRVHLLLHQVAPALLNDASLLDALFTHLETSAKSNNHTNPITLPATILHRLKQCLSTEELENLLIILEGIEAVFQENSITTIANLEHWLNCQKENVPLSGEHHREDAQKSESSLFF